MCLNKNEFDDILIDKLTKITAMELIAIPGIYEILSEEFNNDIIKEYKENRPFRLAKLIKSYHDKNSDINGRFIGHITK